MGTLTLMYPTCHSQALLVHAALSHQMYPHIDAVALKGSTWPVVHNAPLELPASSALTAPHAAQV